MKFIDADDAASPPAPGEDSTSKTTQASDALHIVKAVWDGVRSGERISDVLNTYLGNDRSASKWSAAYQKGGFHLAADLFGGAYLTTALAGSPQRTPDRSRLTSGPVSICLVHSSWGPVATFEATTARILRAQKRL